MRDCVTVGQKPQDGGPGWRREHRVLRFGLATRVLILVVAFVMATEITVYVPIVANYRDNWLRRRLSGAYTATLVLEAAPRAMVPASVSRQLLENVGVRIIVLKTHGTRQILAAAALPHEVDEFYDMRHSSLLQALASTYRTYTAKANRVVTILGNAPTPGDAIEVTMDEAPLTAALHHFAWRVLLVSLAISMIVACLAVISIHLMILRPVRRLTTNLIEFGDDPENAARVIVPSGHRHEIGCAEEALATMQDTLVRELNQKKHLAALGLAVAKINHDMRNMLGSAQLLSDRLANVTDPLAQRIAPKLVATLDRAIRFCQATLTYGRAADEVPKPQRMELRAVVTEAAESAALCGSERIEFANKVAPGFEIWADPEQMFRVLTNLIRNGHEALVRAGPSPGQSARVTATAHHEGGRAVIEIADTGPGVPPMVRAQLFTPFSNSSRPGGSGLGLAIAADLVRAHSGSITLVNDADSTGAIFRVTLPMPPASA
ncbi:HAMP domain-containing sensor histidine kinase [Methylovirgula sp. HY1]|uniref:sensor histidine kinase n=1 Tax=Methylovirgula sp. HY1 TaxID=2822761 RepID=UPI001C5A6634|nr:HAMP domain-containing sensor histidine kinase [Methylovirgula sp. HY1]QXX76162.1 Sensor protein ZraS [Methylovirgula sp. HY1]